MFYAILLKGDNFFCFPAQQAPLKRRLHKRKEFAPMGSKFFPLKVGPLQKGTKQLDNLFVNLFGTHSANLLRKAHESSRKLL